MNKSKWYDIGAALNNARFYNLYDLTQCLEDAGIKLERKDLLTTWNYCIAKGIA
jgi:hypothetical protein